MKSLYDNLLHREQADTLELFELIKSILIEEKQDFDEFVMSKLIN